MLKIAVIGVAGAILSMWIKGIKPEFSVWITLGTGLCLGLLILAKMEGAVKELQFLQTFFSGYGSYIRLLLKIVGITYLSEFSADLCKDAGAATLASQIELMGKLSILILCVPVIRALLETVDLFLGG